MRDKTTSKSEISLEMGRLGEMSGSVTFEGEISPNIKKRTEAVSNAWRDQRDLNVKMRVKR